MRHLAPLCKKPLTIPRPIPPDEPVTKHTLPFNDMLVIFSQVFENTFAVSVLSRVSTNGKNCFMCTKEYYNRNKFDASKQHTHFLHAVCYPARYPCPCFGVPRPIFNGQRQSRTKGQRPDANAEIDQMSCKKQSERILKLPTLPSNK